MDVSSNGSHINWYAQLITNFKGINNNRVSLQGAKDVPENLKEVILSCEQDPFFKQTMYDNFGELGNKIKIFMDDYQKKHQQNKKIASIGTFKKIPIESFQMTSRDLLLITQNLSNYQEM